MTNNQDIEIRIFPTREEISARLNAEEEPRVAEIIRTEVLPRTQAQYYRVDVKIKRNPDQTVNYFIAYLLRKDIYLAEVVKVEVGNDYSAPSITWDYNDSEGEEEEGDDEEEHPAPTLEDAYAPYDFVIATPVPEIPTANAAVEEIHKFLTDTGFNCLMLLGKDANIANYKQYLASGNKGFVNIGHGNTNEIVLYDGRLNYAWFNSVSNQAVAPAVVYFNSCQVHNDPLKTAIMKAGSRTFIGGIVNLAIGASEKVCKTFWNLIMSNQARMGDALKQAELITGYPNPGSHGITGDLGPFSLSMKIAHAMWVHGHSIHIEYPDRIANIRRAGFFAEIEGKPGTKNWLHFAIPTSVIVDGERLRVGSVLIDFRTLSADASVNAVHIYDGKRKIKAYDNILLTGNIGMKRFDVPAHPYVIEGIGISIEVGFGVEMMSHCMEFVSAGCDFVK